MTRQYLGPLLRRRMEEHPADAPANQRNMLAQHDLPALEPFARLHRIGDHYNINKKNAQLDPSRVEALAVKYPGATKLTVRRRVRHELEHHGQRCDEHHRAGVEGPPEAVEAFRPATANGTRTLVLC